MRRRCQRLRDRIGEPVLGKNQSGIHCPAVIQQAVRCEMEESEVLKFTGRRHPLQVLFAGLRLGEQNGPREKTGDRLEFEPSRRQ